MSHIHLNGVVKKKHLALVLIQIMQSRVSDV